MPLPVTEPSNQLTRRCVYIYDALEYVDALNDVLIFKLQSYAARGKHKFTDFEIQLIISSLREYKDYLSEMMGLLQGNCNQFGRDIIAIHEVVLLLEYN